MNRSSYIQDGSRYADTAIYEDVFGETPVLGPWQPPAEFAAIRSSWKTHMVRQSEVGFLDIIAVRYFGDGAEALWWVIAHVNGIITPDAEMYAGQRLWVPPRDAVAGFQSRGVYAA